MHARTQKCTHMHSQPCTNANCWKMLMPVIISEPPLSSLPQHSFRGHRSEKESVPSWLLLIGQTGRPLPGYQLTLTIHREDFEYLPSFSKWFFFYYYYYHFLLIGVFILTLSIVLSVCSCFAYVFFIFLFLWSDILALDIHRQEPFYRESNSLWFECDALRDDDQHSHSLLECIFWIKLEITTMKQNEITGTKYLMTENVTTLKCMFLIIMIVNVY